MKTIDQRIFEEGMKGMTFTQCPWAELEKKMSQRFVTLFLESNSKDKKFKMIC